MTDVYLAFDTSANRHAVLKIVEESPDPLTQLILEAERRGADLQKQLHEADARVIEVYDYGHLDGFFFVSMQYIEGRTVAEILKQEGRIEPARAAQFAVEILSQLDKLHSFQAVIDGQRRSVVHGDIKPSNIQIGTNDEVRLLDFGIAKALTFTHSRTHLGAREPQLLFAGAIEPRTSGSARGFVGGGRDAVRNGVGRAAVSGAGYAEARGSDSIAASAARAAGKLSGCDDGDSAQSAGGRSASALCFGDGVRKRFDAVPAEPPDGGGEGAARFVEEQSDGGEAALPHLPERVASMAETVRRSVLKLKPAAGATDRIGDEHFRGAVLGIAGGPRGVRAVGLLLSLLAREQRAARESGFHTCQCRRDQSRLGFAAADAAAECVSGRDFAGESSSAELADAALLAGGRRRDRSVIATIPTHAFEDFDWPKAALCFTHLIEMDRNDRSRAWAIWLCAMDMRIWSAPNKRRRRISRTRPR